MDLRPKIAADIVDAIIEDRRRALGPERRSADADAWDDVVAGIEGAIRDRWVRIALSKIVHHSLEWPEEKGYSLSTTDPEVVESFITKYPSIRPLLQICEDKAREFWPDVVLVREVSNDPEGCHTCREGQHLGLRVLRNNLPVEDDTRREEYFDWWCFLPEREGTDHELLHVSLEYTENTSDR